MSASKTSLWVCLVLCVVVGSKVIYKKRGQSVTMYCDDVDQSKDLDWKHNNILVLKIKGKNGLQSKGSADVVKKARLVGTKLMISSVDISDSGTYSYTGYDQRGIKITGQHTLHVVSVSVSPSEKVLHSTDVTLSCEIPGDTTAQVQWMKPPGEEPYRDPGKVITLKSVASADAGQWTCVIKDEKGNELEKISVVITVIGPLTSHPAVVASPGGTADLPCFLANPSGIQIMGGGWTRDPPADLLFPSLHRETNDLRWDGMNVTSRVMFSHKKLSTDFTVTLKNVQTSDAGPYVCKITFEGGHILSTRSILKVQSKSIIDNSSRTIDQQIIVSQGAAAELPCTCSSSNSQYVVRGGWTREPPTDVQFPVLMHTEVNGLHWSGAGVHESKVKFSDKQLNNNFTVILKNVEHADAGVYVCTLIFEDGKKLRTVIVLKIVGEGTVVASEVRPPSKDEEFWQKPVLLNLALWVWVAISAGSLLLIVLVITIVLVTRRNKKNKRKSEQVKPSVKAYATQELLPTRYEFAPKQTERRHHHGNKDRPLPPIPKPQYRACKQKI